MSNPYISIFSTKNLPDKNKEFELLWERFVTKDLPGDTPTLLRKNIIESWQRCQENGVDPNQIHTKHALPDNDLNQLIKESELYQIAKPIIDNLFDKMKGTGYLITLSNDAGWIIYLNGEKSLLREAEKMNFAIGMDWSESGAGTNAIGTSIITKSPIQIFSAEHYCQGCHPWTCSSAPITHPISKEVIGAIDFTGLWSNAQPHTLGLAISTAQIIESQFANKYMKQNNPSTESVFQKKEKHMLISSKLSLQKNGAWKEIIGSSKPILSAINKCHKASPSSVPILLLGESGTGKEKFASSIHKSSPRSDQPFIAINCGAIQKELIGSELFGYERGAFTGAAKEGKKGKFEEANGGTLFLDEIGEMPLDLQVHLLRVLQEKEVTRLGSSKPLSVNVRIISATNKNLYDLCKQGLFREDLYFRLNVVSVNLPPLRERKEDILSFTEYFLTQFMKKHEKNSLSLAQQTLNYFLDYDWPGNIRELQNVLEHAVIFSDTHLLTLEDLPTYLFENNYTHVLAKYQQDNLSLKESEERKLLVRLLDEKGRNLSAVAKKLNIARSTLYRKLKKYQLQ